MDTELTVIRGLDEIAVVRGAGGVRLGGTLV